MFFLKADHIDILTFGKSMLSIAQDCIIAEFQLFLQ